MKTSSFKWRAAAVNSFFPISSTRFVVGRALAGGIQPPIGNPTNRIDFDIAQDEEGHLQSNIYAEVSQ